MDTPSRKIILQTKSVRVIHIPRPTNLPESAGKLDNILIERRERDGMGELHWERFIELTWTESQSAFGDLMHSMFNQMVGDVDAEMVVQTSLGALPVVQRLDAQLRNLLLGLSTMVVEVVEPSTATGMPFDNRDGSVAVDITPALLGQLASKFIRTNEGHVPATVLLRRLLQCAAQELAK